MMKLDYFTTTFVTRKLKIKFYTGWLKKRKLQPMVWYSGFGYDSKLRLDKVTYLDISHGTKFSWSQVLKRCSNVNQLHIDAARYKELKYLDLDRISVVCINFRYAICIHQFSLEDMLRFIITKCVFATRIVTLDILPKEFNTRVWTLCDSILKSLNNNTCL